MTIFFASQNQGKIAEVVAIFSRSNHQLITLNDQDVLKKMSLNLDSELVVAETGQTLEENAELKAKVWADLTQLATLADDSGLLLEAFPGFPGVNSNRWLAGTATERNQGILAKLEKQSNRRASFKTVLCFYDPLLQKSRFFAGEIRGTIAKQSSGQAGFGYDPIFIPDGYEKTFAELGVEIKNQISHRAQALAALSQSDLFI